MIYRAVVLAESAELTLADFPLLALAAANSGSPSEPRRYPPGSAAPRWTHAGGAVDARGAESRPFASSVNEPRPGDLELPSAAPAAVVPLVQVERQAITQALARTGGNMSQAALQLGIGRATLYRKFKKYGLSPH
jgi:transcriptional regulator of acetoin/glycerol metabolism